MNQIYDEYSRAFRGRDIVPGAGNIDSGIVFIGEAPGKDEIRLKMPFVGKAGENLAGMLKSLELSRDDIYITNAIKYGLRETDPVSKRQRNRRATGEEILLCIPHLLKELECLDPKIVVTLGAVPLKALLHRRGIKVSEYANREFEHNGRIVYPMYHPAALIYDPKLGGSVKIGLERLKGIILDIPLQVSKYSSRKHNRSLFC